MELRPRKSFFQILLTASSFSWAFAALWWSGLSTGLQTILTSVVLLLACFAARDWWLAPVGISLRNEMIFLRYSNAEQMVVRLDSGLPHLFWIRFLRGRFGASTFLYRDSFTSAEWAALQRNVRREMSEKSSSIGFRKS